MMVMSKVYLLVFTTDYSHSLEKLSQSQNRNRAKLGPILGGIRKLGDHQLGPILGGLRKCPDRIVNVG